MSLAPRGIDVRLSGFTLVFRASLKDSTGAKLTTGTTNILLFEVQSDGTLKTYDWSSNTFKSSGMTSSQYQSTMTVRTGIQNADAALNTGMWTAALATLTGFTVGGVYIVQVTNSGASPVDQEREFQYGGVEGDLTVTVDGMAASDVQEWLGSEVTKDANSRPIVVSLDVDSTDSAGTAAIAAADLATGTAQANQAIESNVQGHVADALTAFPVQKEGVAVTAPADMALDSTVAKETSLSDGTVTLNAAYDAAKTAAQPGGDMNAAKIGGQNAEIEFNPALGKYYLDINVLTIKGVDADDDIIANAQAGSDASFTSYGPAKPNDILGGDHSAINMLAGVAAASAVVDTDALAAALIVSGVASQTTLQALKDEFDKTGVVDGTDWVFSANTLQNAPSSSFSAPTVDEIVDEIDTRHGDGSYEKSPANAVGFVVACKDSGGHAVVGAQVYSSSDIQGHSIISGPYLSDAQGNADCFLALGLQYIWILKAGNNFNNPQTVTVA